jgi:hypothetical protein
MRHTLTSAAYQENARGKDADAKSLFVESHVFQRSFMRVLWYRGGTSLSTHNSVLLQPLEGSTRDQYRK